MGCLNVIDEKELKLDEFILQSEMNGRQAVPKHAKSTPQKCINIWNEMNTESFFFWFLVKEISILGSFSILSLSLPPLNLEGIHKLRTVQL